jgi:hypothetical protein
MRLEWRTYTTAKSGNRPEENEDVCLPASVAPDEGRDFRCVLTDGATSTSFSQHWARILAETSIKQINSCQQGLKPVLQQGASLWQSYLNQLDLPWHALEKTRQGAFSTLLWFKAAQTGYANKTLGVWQALAVGDTCFIQLRDNKIQASFPLLFSESFKEHPFLLSSVEARNERLNNPGNISKAQGAFEGGDEFLFMTDALAGWFLKSMEDGRSPMDWFRPLIGGSNGESSEFDILIRRLRVSGAIKNDDTTLGYLKIHREASRYQERAWN